MMKPNPGRPARATGSPRCAALLCTFPLLTLGLLNGRRFSPKGGSSGPSPLPDLSIFFEQSSDGFLTLDAGHTVLEVNSAACQLLREPADRIVGRSVLEVDLLARMLTAGSILQRVRTEPSPVLEEVRVPNSEGQPVQCRIQAFAVSDGATLLHLLDTTTVLRARSALGEVEHMRRAVVEAMTEVSWTMALPEERLIEVSPAVEHLFGYQPAAFKQRPELWDELVHPSERERVRGELRRGLASGRPFEIEFTGLHRDHHDLPHLVNRVIPVPDDNGFLGRCAGFIEDRRLEHEMKETISSAQANIRHILESVSSGVLVVGPGERGIEVLLFNRRLADMLRLDEPLKPGTLLAQAPDPVRRIAYGPGSEAEFERRLLSEDTRDEMAEFTEPTRVLRRFAGPVRDALGGVVGRIFTVEDVTSSWLLHRRLTHAQKMESMGRLAGGVAHDFNNLLGTIIGFSSELLEQTPTGDGRRESLTHIVQAAERAARLTSALLTFSRSARFERLPVQINRVIEDSYHLMRSGLDPSVSLELSLEPLLPALTGDALLLQQLLVHLVEEVSESLSGGGSLRIATRVASEGTETSRRSVILELSTSVAGLGDREVSLREHDAFTETRNGFSRTIAEDIVRVHGGHLISGVAASPAVFRADFPVEVSDEAPLLIPEEGVARGNETILVVDDEPGLRTLAKSGLTQRGFHVLTADNGEQALEILRSGTTVVDLVLLDLSMPGLSGERVLRAIRGFRTDLPVIIASGYATVESQASWNAAGAQGFVAKPYRIRDVAAKLREVLDRSHGRVS